MPSARIKNFKRNPRPLFAAPPFDHEAFNGSATRPLPHPATVTGAERDTQPLLHLRASAVRAVGTNEPTWKKKVPAVFDHRNLGRMHQARGGLAGANGHAFDPGPRHVRSHLLAHLTCAFRVVVSYGETRFNGPTHAP